MAHLGPLGEVGEEEGVEEGCWTGEEGMEEEEALSKTSTLFREEGKGGDLSREREGKGSDRPSPSFRGKASSFLAPRYVEAARRGQGKTWQ